MTEAQIETRVERFTDAMDRQYLAGTITEEIYRAQLAQIDRWARLKLQFATREDR